jgi:cobalt-zinc-cadmium efflux system outer membrane protein
MKRSFYTVYILAALLTVSREKLAAAEPAAISADPDAPATNDINTATVSIDDLVADALKFNPELAFYDAEIAAAKGERRVAAAYPNLEISGDIGRKRSREIGGGLAGEGTAWSVSVAQPLEFPGRIALRKAIANRQVELAELGLDQFRATLASRVREAAYQLHIAQAQARAAEQAAQRGQELIEVLVQRDPAGVNPLLETRLIEASVITLNARATEAFTQATALTGELNQLRGQPLSTPVQIAPPTLTFAELPSAETLVTEALANNFDIRAQQLELAQQGLRVDLSRKDRWKEITMAPFYSQERAGERESTVGVGLSIPVPIWNRNTGNIQAAQARQQQAEVAVSLTQRRVERELREKVAAYNARLAEMSRWRPEIVESLREAAELADRHYRLGAVPVATYVELQEKYLEALEAILTTRARALQHRQEIQLLSGTVTAHRT